MSGRVLVITSGKGGVGKTTATANLGAALALRGKRVLVIDADIGLRNLDVIMGLENRIVFNLVDVIKGVCKHQQAIIKSKRSNNLFLLPASQTDDKNVINVDEMRDLLNKLKQEFHFILVDCPAGIEQGFKNACAGADQAIVVTTPEVSSIRDADRVIGLLASEGIETSLLINRVDRDLVKQGDMIAPQEVVEMLGIDQIGMIFRDNDIVISSNSGDPIVYNEKSKVGKAFLEVADRLLGVAVPISTNISESFWTRLGRKFSRAV
ncbi:MAG: septum site-determining protein MinD [Deltaproteobacteria bacterium]|jgi:septum site-determining protein MinD|nr:septum site-determining protein MinD [Deltaproteobacteria bacterium]